MLKRRKRAVSIRGQVLELSKAIEANLKVKLNVTIVKNWSNKHCV